MKGGPKESPEELLHSLNVTPGAAGPRTKCLADLRGMSKPYFFCFNVQERGNILVAHAVVFTSLILPPSTKIEFLQEGDDPRVAEFIRYINANFNKPKT